MNYLLGTQVSDEFFIPLLDELQLAQIGIHGRLLSPNYVPFCHLEHPKLELLFLLHLSSNLDSVQILVIGSIQLNELVGLIVFDILDFLPNCIHNIS